MFIKSTLVLALVVVVSAQFGSDSRGLGAQLGINMQSGNPLWGGSMDVDYRGQGKGIVGNILGSDMEDTFIRRPIEGADRIVRGFQAVPGINIGRGAMATASRMAG